ncbi:hypothetical protein [Pseudomonas syringae]|uniref:hypothetical protein n=1 Tax=Pseudomonas syringae TaxID=317 RepID=UPI00200A68EF|nr:hypothetical protein [Pseudomonas syringae]MCK9706177.1 hypothetical protein [Pseudomonas syringae pv. syringae]
MICALCEKEKGRLIDSHFIPSAAYPHVRGQGEYNGLSPIRVDSFKGTAAHNDKQVTMELLCRSCEDLFSKNGERIMGCLWATAEGFPFLEKLRSNGPCVTADAYQAYDASKLETEITQGLTYFAASVFWRAQVWKWGYEGDPYRKSLGDKYEAVFRKFLLGEGPLDAVRFILEVNTDEGMTAFMSFPTSTRYKGEISHVFTILGLRFNMYVGGTINNDTLATFKILNTNMLIYALSFRQSPAYSKLAEQVQNRVVPKGKLAKHSARG